MKTPVVLVGFPATGKTSVARELNKKFGWSFTDVDEKISQKAGKSVAEIIRVEGESKFRELETRELAECFKSNTKVISVGGGALLAIENRKQIFENAAVIKLAASKKEIVKRVVEEEARSGDKQVVRPLLSNKGTSIDAAVSNLLEQRKSLYDLDVVSIWTDWITAEDVAVEIERILRLDKLEGRQSLFPSEISSNYLGGLRSDVLVGKESRYCGVRLLRDLWKKCSSLALVVDSSIANKWGVELSELLIEQGFEVRVIELPSGEKTKSLEQVQRTAEELLKSGFTRVDGIVGLGGGVVGDVVGLVASLYMRGINLAHFPTTIVAQVDSAIGGKTAVNLEGGKNILGTFYPARIIISDLDFLSTLPEREYLAGLAEVIKYGLIASRDFFSWLETNVEGILRRDYRCLQRIVEVSTQLKLKTVVEDLQDVSGKRALLNFGHTVGHAVEQLTGYKEFLHGEAISIGMVVALKLGEMLKQTRDGIGEQTEDLLKKFKLPVSLPEKLLGGAEIFLEVVDLKGDSVEQKLQGFPNEEATGFYRLWSSALLADKKRVSKMVNYVVVEEVGKASIRQLSLDVVVEAVARSGVEGKRK